VAQERLARIIELHREIQSEINHAEIGRTVEVLVERAARSAGDMLGRTEHNKVVAFPGDASLVGRYLTVRLTSTTGATFRGAPVEQRVAAVACSQAVPAGAHERPRGTMPRGLVRSRAHMIAPIVAATVALAAGSATALLGDAGPAAGTAALMLG